MEVLSSYTMIIGVSSIIIISFLFGIISKRTNIPSVLLLIILGVGMQYVLDYYIEKELDYLPILEVLGIVGLIMIVLEAALELELKREKMWPIFKSLFLAIVGLGLSTYAAAMILHYTIDGMSLQSALIYATPLSILSSAIIIPSVGDLSSKKKEFHIYESTFSDIIGIMLFYFLTGKLNPESDTGIAGFTTNLIVTIAVSVVASYAIILIFQHIKTRVKLFLLISVLLLLYAIGKQMHMSSLIIILVFGLVIANMKLFFKGFLGRFLMFDKAKHIYHELHTITAETAFVVRTFFFVIFGITISIASLFDLKVAMISIAILISIYLIRFVMFRLFLGKDISPQWLIAPRGLITVLLFYNIPASAEVANFEPGILLFVIIGSSLIMTGALISDKQKAMSLIKKAQNDPVTTQEWTAPDFEGE